MQSLAQMRPQYGQLVHCRVQRIVRPTLACWQSILRFREKITIKNYIFLLLMLIIMCAATSCNSHKESVTVTKTGSDSSNANSADRIENAKRPERISLEKITSIFEGYEAGEDPIILDENLDQWILEHVDPFSPSFRDLPDPIRYIYAGRYIEWDVGNGGFAQAAYNNPGFLKDARDCYEVIGRPAAASLVDTAIGFVEDGDANFKSKDIGKLFKEFSASKLTDLDSKLEEAGWWTMMEQRMAYAARHKDIFIALNSDTTE